MSTFLNGGLISLNERLKEVELILNEAKANYEKNQPLYNSLCRAAQVLLTAHFEGYLKDLVKNSLDDINHFSNFKCTHFDLKKRFCEYFFSPFKEEKNSKDNHTRVTELIAVFDALDTKFKKEYFAVYTDNMNPKATVLDKIAEQYGVKKFFEQLKKSNLDLVFSNTNSDNIQMRNKIKEYLLKSTENYPYDIDLAYLEMDSTKTATDNLWDAFLSELLKRRHDIAHGKEIENSVGHSVIEADKIKIEVLIYAFTSFICVKANPITVEA